MSLLSFKMCVGKLVNCALSSFLLILLLLLFFFNFVLSLLFFFCALLFFTFPLPHTHPEQGLCDQCWCRHVSVCVCTKYCSYHFFNTITETNSIKAGNNSVVLPILPFYYLEQNYLSFVYTHWTHLEDYGKLYFLARLTLYLISRKVKLHDFLRVTFHSFFYFLNFYLS